jgi:hypothetical protein
MPFGRGRGFGRGWGRGFGFRGYSPPWPYVGLGRGGLPRGWAYRNPGFASYALHEAYSYPWGFAPYGMAQGYRNRYPYYGYVY